ncbi:MAG: hypothetical protein ACQETF_12520, partial [Bacteroidota bacterium]
TALSTLIANIYNWLILLRRIGGHMELPFYKVLPFPFYFSVLGTSVLVAVPVWYLRMTFIPEESIIIGLIAGSTLFLISFAAAGTFLKVITADDWQKLKDWLMFKFLKSN